MRLPIRKNTRLCDREKNYTPKERFLAYAWVYVGTRMRYWQICKADDIRLGNKNGQ